MNPAARRCASLATVPSRLRFRSWISAAIGEDIFAEGRVLKRGKEIIYSDVRVTNGAGKLLAQGTVVYRIIERAAE